MAESAGPYVHADPPLRTFTPEEATAAVPVLEGIFRRMDGKLARLKEARDLVEDQEAYWGADLEDAPRPEQERHAHLVADLEEVRSSLERDIDEVRAIGGELKDPHLGLVDFYAWINGDLAYLCWRRGEPRIGYWHSLEAGYAGRQPLPAKSRAEP